MARSGGDGTPDGRLPGGESQPSELWIESGGSTVPGGDAPRRGEAPRGPGGSGRTRWIALAVGFAVLVAVIAVQHFAGGSAASPTASTSSSGIAAPTGTLASSAASPVPVTSSAGSIGSSEALGGADSSTAPADGAPEPVGSSAAPAPVTAAVRPGPLPAGQTWELVGYGPKGVMRYRPATGTLTVTPVPPVLSSNLLSFVVTSNSVVLRSMDDVESYLVPDGKRATPLTGLLGRPTRVLPGPDAGHVWVVSSSDQQRGHTSLMLVDTAGKPTGPRIDLPDALDGAGGYSVSPDGAGYALVQGLGGVYDARPDGVHLVTHGQVVAVGPTALLVYDCNDTARCSASVIDSRTGTRHTVPGLSVPSDPFPVAGPISPDGAYAAIVGLTPGQPTVELINLRTGRTHDLKVGLGGQFGTDALSQLAFTPDSRYLLVAGTVGVSPVDTSTGRALDPLPVPPMSAIAVRAVPGGS